MAGGLTRYEVVTDADSFFIDINQNDADDLLGTDGRGDVWAYLGDIQYASGAITVSQQPTAQNSFVSMRAYGLLFERVPAPGTVTPLALAAAAATGRRR